MDKITNEVCNVYLINTGMDTDGKRFDLDFTRKCVKTAIDLDVADDSKNVLQTLEELIE